MAYTWFRLYSDIIDDPKLEVMTHAQRWLWIVVMSLANRSPERGYLLLSWEQSGNSDGNVPVPVRVIAKKADLTIPEVEEGLQLFRQMGMIDRSDAGVLHVANWDKRQFKSDDVTSRTQKHKQKKREEEQPGNVPSGVPGTPQTTDSDINTPLPPTRGKSEDYPSDFEDWWAVYRRKDNKKGAFAKYKATLKKGATKEQLLTAARNYMEARAKEEPKFDMHAATFLGPQERWKEFLSKPQPTGNAAPAPTYRPPDEATLALQALYRQRGDAHV